MTNDSPASRRFRPSRFRNPGKLFRQVGVRLGFGLLLVIVVAVTGCGVSRSDLGEIVTELPNAPVEKKQAGEAQENPDDTSVSAPGEPAAASSPTESPAK
ncbi:MAG TPA: hypothetical protein VGN12_29285 [Pirellulales bacterium]|jgi:hypothetical protein